MSRIFLQMGLVHETRPYELSNLLNDQKGWHPADLFLGKSVDLSR